MNNGTNISENIWVWRTDEVRQEKVKEEKYNPDETKMNQHFHFFHPVKNYELKMQI